MALSANVVRKFNGEGLYENYDVTAATHIYSGGMVFLVAATGHASPSGAAGANRFAGIAENEVNNTGAITTTKPLKVRMWQDEQMVLAGVVAADLGKQVYGTDDNTLTLGGAGATLVGVLKRIVSGTTVMIHISRPI